MSEMNPRQSDVHVSAMLAREQIYMIGQTSSEPEIKQVH